MNANATDASLDLPQGAGYQQTPAASFGADLINLGRQILQQLRRNHPEPGSWP